MTARAIKALQSQHILTTCAQGFLRRENCAHFLKGNVMPKLLPTPIRAIKGASGMVRAAYQHFQHQPYDRRPSVNATVPDIERTEPILPEAPHCLDDDLRRCAWNGSIGDGLLHKIHREQLSAGAAARAAHAVRCSTVSNSLAALEAELCVLVEQPPAPAPEPKVLKIGPAKKGA